MNSDPVYRASFKKINTLELVEGQKKATTKTIIVEYMPVNDEVIDESESLCDFQMILIYFKEDH